MDQVVGWMGNSNPCNNDLEKNKNDVCLDLYNYLEYWFDEHILKYDKEAVEFLKKSGVN